jgi:hypothetical protein
MMKASDDWEEFLLMLEVHEQKKTVNTLPLGIKN